MSAAARDRVVDNLRRAFSGTAGPSANELAYKEDWDHESIVADFWRHRDGAVPDNVLEAHAESIVAFKPKAFAYFLPTYLIYSVTHVDSAVTDAVLSALLTATTSSSSHWKARLARLTDRQRHAVAAYVRFMTSNDLPGFEQAELDRMLAFWSS